MLRHQLGIFVSCHRLTVHLGTVLKLPTDLVLCAHKNYRNWRTQCHRVEWSTWEDCCLCFAIRARIASISTSTLRHKVCGHARFICFVHCESGIYPWLVKETHLYVVMVGQCRYWKVSPLPRCFHSHLTCRVELSWQPHRISTCASTFWINYVHRNVLTLSTHIHRYSVIDSNKRHTQPELLIRTTRAVSCFIYASSIWFCAWPTAPVNSIRQNKCTYLDLRL